MMWTQEKILYVVFALNMDHVALRQVLSIYIQQREISRSELSDLVLHSFPRHQCLNV